MIIRCKNGNCRDQMDRPSQFVIKKIDHEFHNFAYYFCPFCGHKITL